ncbi:unnamed protein product [Rotaria magnacalcarata]|uniref:Uncharacterized protein n=1 Tax=Rotaria magnacalcarata TaxID=392030 RepID=A0A816PXV9_9BILA|nr:unnamed protein product [Rotaria magnacalcarata]CAF2054804.1 unnamed protein product [Rotaria magnacalcarata]CAF3984632.1 unnamed protein product [Rotaria magnacalcarata]CAF4064077.1 unnamed protein product [Rotaria magnacalcarata]
MSSSNNAYAKSTALEVIKNFRVPELQTILDYGNVPRHGQKRDLLQRCKLLISSSFTPQLANKIQQINKTRARSSRSNHVSSSTSSSKNPIVLPKTPPIEVLPPSNQIQFINLPFFEKMRSIESSNMPVDWHSFSPFRFVLNDTDIELIRKNIAKVFLRIAPTTTLERHNDVSPPYLFVQCNNQAVINNNVSKQVGSQAHSISFPTDLTDKIILKANTTNTLTFLWLQSPTSMSFKNLPKSYTLAIQLVHCVSLDTLLEIILKREPYSNKTDNDNDSDIEIEDLGLMTTQQRVSLICPITQSLISLPAKSSYCSHLTCFDLKAFLLMNEKRLQWTCPLCKKSASFESLRIDERLKSILSNAPANCSTVEIDSSIDCQYILDTVKQEKVEFTETTHENQNSEEESINNYTSKSRHQSDESDCIVLSSGSESEDEDNNDNDDDINNSSSPTSPILNQNDDIDDRFSNKVNDHASQLSRSSHSTVSPILSTVDDTNFWDDIAQITYDLSPNANNAQLANRKRSNSSTSSVLSSCSSPSKSQQGPRLRKRNKRPLNVKSRTTDIELITLSSNDSSDNGDQST